MPLYIMLSLLNYFLLSSINNNINNSITVNALIYEDIT